MRWFRERGRERDLEKELQSDLDEETADQVENGLSPEAARYAAQRAFGNVTLVKEDVRQVWGLTLLDSIGQDFRFAYRSARKNVAFTAVGVLSVALGIGANTAIFTFVNAALLKPLPYPHSDRIVALSEIPPKQGEATPVHPRSYVEWRDRSRSFEALALAQTIPLNTDGSDGPEQISALWTTPELFAVFGVAPVLGRVFTNQESRPGASPAVVLSNGYWRRRFGSDPQIVGKTIRVQQQVGIIEGVMPPGFQVGAADHDVFLALPIDRNRPQSVGSRAFACYGRLRAGVTLDAARSEMKVVADQVSRDYAIDREWGILIVSLREQLVHDSRRSLLLLQSVVALVLLVACANLAGLLLARGAARRSEMALRVSLGAARFRLVQQLLIESFAIALAGGIIGLALGTAASRLLTRLAQNAVSFGQPSNARLDGQVLLFALTLSVITALAFGLMPAWRLSNSGPYSGLGSRGAASGDRSQSWFRAVLVGSEIALSVVLLIGAGLFLRSFSQMLSVRLGFQPEHVLTMKMFVTGPPQRRAGVIEGVRHRVEKLPEVRAAGTIQFLPLSGLTNRGPFHFLGGAEQVAAPSLEAETAVISGQYFSAMGIPLLRGRTFTDTDTMAGTRVALVNQTFVEKYCGNRDPVGREVVGDWSVAQPATIIGVVGDTRHDALTSRPEPTFFLAQAQSPGYYTYIVVRTVADPAGVVAAIRHEIRQVDPQQGVTDVKLMREYVSMALAKPRLYTVLVGGFSSLALILAAIGLYGLITYSVEQRTQEIGIRMALGANPLTVLRSVLAAGGRLTLVGLAVGVGFAAILSRFLATFLYDMSPYDLMTYSVVVLLLGSVAMIAAAVPALRASRIDPIVALRYQ